MGYYTDYELSIFSGIADIKAVKLRLDKIMEMENEESLLLINSDDVIVSDDVLKWYDHDAECAEMSKYFPNVVFRLHGEGDGEDLWNSYYCNGECQICRAVVTYPPFNQKELTDIITALQNDKGRL